MATPTISSVKLENGRKESRKRRIDDNDPEYHALKIRHLEVMTSYYEKKTTLIDFQIKEIMQKRKRRSLNPQHRVTANKFAFLYI